MEAENIARGGIHPGDWVWFVDGRIGRVCVGADGRYRVRVRRSTSKTKQFLWLAEPSATKLVRAESRRADVGQS